MKRPPRSQKRSAKSLLVSPIAVLVFSIGAFPPLVLALVFFHYVHFTTWWSYLFLPFIFYVGAVVFFLSELIVSGSIVRLFNIRYLPGLYSYSPLEKNAFKWVVMCVLYTPMRRLLEMFPVGRIKNVYLRLLGMKVGKNTLVGGAIQDPCITEIGENTTMGEYAVIYGHIHDTKEGTILIAPVKIGKDCVIGAGAILMPGVVVKDGVTIAAGAVVPKNQVLKKGKIYAGIPAKELEKKKKK